MAHLILHILEQCEVGEHLVANLKKTKLFSEFMISALCCTFSISSTYCNGPLPLNGQLVTDIVSSVTGADIVSAATAMHCDWVEAFHQ
jgi:hypothetical protein